MMLVKQKDLIGYAKRSVDADMLFRLTHHFLIILLINIAGYLLAGASPANQFIPVVVSGETYLRLDTTRHQEMVLLLIVVELTKKSVICLMKLKKNVLNYQPNCQ